MFRKAVFLVAITCVCLAEAAVGGTKARDPDPADGAAGVMSPLLRWTKGDTAALHNVYLGLTPTLTEADRVGERVQWEMHYHAPGFQPGTVYYWRVDEIDKDGVTIHTGDVWSFTTQALTAYRPSPVDGAGDVGLAPTLAWMPGSGAMQHHLYFGASPDAVTQGAAEADKGVLETAVTTFSPGALEGAATYYWRVDEILMDKTVRTGPVWKFTTFLSVDDFEGYTDDEGSRIYQAWIDGYADQSSGSTVGHIDAPFAEQTIVHGGTQSMPLEYNNVDVPHYSEAVRTWDEPGDWSAGGATILTLHFRGRSSNSVERLYLAVEDDRGKTAVAAYPDSNQVAMPAWTRWEIPLSTFSDAGVDLAAIEKLYVGVGDPDNPAPGGTGVLFFDDIYAGGPGATLPSVLFAEDFEGLTLGPKVDEGVAGDAVWTKAAPPGWTIDDTGVPGAGDPTQDGVTEWAGWGFAGRAWWAETAGDQNRTQFTRGTGTVAIADPDEWDDAGHAEGRYNTYLSTPAIDISAAKPGTLKVLFDSSWRPEFADYGEQTGNLKVSFDGGEPQELFLWLSDTASPKFKADATNEAVTIKIDAPAGARTMVLTFGLFNCGNNWWWAIDNVQVTATTE